MTRSNLRLLTLLGIIALTMVVGGSFLLPTANAAPQVSLLTFSNGMTDTFEPIGPSFAFDDDNDGVYVTFTYSDLPQGSQLTRIVRRNGEDFNYDDPTYGFLDCCPGGGSGRYGFRVLQQDGDADKLPGGAYEVRIYLNGAEIQYGGFGVSGDEDDNDNDDDQDHDDDDDDDDDNGNDDDDDDDD